MKRYLVDRNIDPCRAVDEITARQRGGGQWVAVSMQTYHHAIKTAFFWINLQWNNEPCVKRLTLALVILHGSQNSPDAGVRAAYNRIHHMSCGDTSNRGTLNSWTAAGGLYALSAFHAEWRIKLFDPQPSKSCRSVMFLLQILYLHIITEFMA